MCVCVEATGKMGQSQTVHELDGTHYPVEDRIQIKIEIGLTGGYPRRWYGHVVDIIYPGAEVTVATFLNSIRTIGALHRVPSLSLEAIHMGDFKPTENDLNRTVQAMGLKSGTLRIYNGMDD